ncbi:hypothetical protein FG93_00014 [Bosea sp. LC85]|nr:hypothetical protein FG93_00014 [Bosea sp. LC85]
MPKGAPSIENRQPTRKPRNWSITRLAASGWVAPVPAVGLLPEYRRRQDRAAGPGPVAGNRDWLIVMALAALMMISWR